MTTAIRAFRTAFLVLIACLTCFVALNLGHDNSAHAAVSLLYFRGQHNGESVTLDWATATELNTAYFYVERAQQPGGPFQMLDDIGLVPSEAPPDGLSGAEYQRIDSDNVEADQTYWYVLVEVERGEGSENRTQPIRASVAAAQSTATPTKTATPRSATTSTSSATAQTPSTPSATPTGNLPPSGMTGTPVSGRTLAIRSTGTVEPGQSDQATTAQEPFTDNQEGALFQGQIDQTPQGNGYPAPALEAAATLLDSAQSAYPDLPPTSQVLATKGYPEPGPPGGLTNGTPLPNIGDSNRISTPPSSDESQEAANSPVLGTLFLWIGFVAALAIFMSAVAGAIYYYSRQRTENG